MPAPAHKTPKPLILPAVSCECVMQEQKLLQQLTHDVDSWVGDAIASMPASARQAQGPLTMLAAPLLRFATAVLKYRFNDAASLRVLRRFLAALIPPPDGLGEGGGGGSDADGQ